ncbi:interleukin-13 receptor subunit alpha-1-like isoform X1 [Bufo bufo]|uniref:interleukin-13 receptor subunit alpha-1-like isoform X1 n=1 Tax=Bufo bufo TaxID=8384 RepID=UPI001ABE76BF|nr:interleukin-13 receptor subunit alpha-1-like isoform X1 [Bufo bufo]
MDSHGRRLLLLLLCLSQDWTCGSAGPGSGQLHPPTNIAFGMNGNFCLFWKWTPADRTANCTLEYKTEILPSVVNSVPEGIHKHPHYSKFFDTRVDLNKNLTLKVHTECGNRASEAITFTSPLAAGSPGNMVRNMTCVWHYKEYVNCTWQPGEEARLGVNYSLHYWITKEDSCPSVENKQPTPFLDLFDEGEPCQNYTYDSGIPVGCLFKLEQDFRDFISLVAVVTDRSHNVKPYIYFIRCINSIAKLKAPVINEVKRTLNNSVFVSWNVSDADIYVEAELKTSNREKPYQTESQSKEIPNVLPDVAFTVKVRLKLSKRVIGLSDSYEQSNFLWSNWSEERTLPAEGERTTSLVLLLLVSLVIIVATVLLLINMRRLLMLLFPRIPDPSKVISSDFQHWLKYGKSVYNEPKKEEVCEVSLLETPQSCFQVE